MKKNSICSLFWRNVIVQLKRPRENIASGMSIVPIVYTEHLQA